MKKTHIIWYVFEAMRPRQWLKNITVFIALVFSRSLFDASAVIDSTLTFIAFCLISGFSYMINDIYDKDSDNIHPEKLKRPIASGALKESTAMKIAGIAGPVIIAICALWSWKVAAVLSIYFILQLAYSRFLKHVVLFDILAIAFSFVLRVFAGAVAINLAPSSWLLFCTILLSLFLSLCKRRHEALLMKETAHIHRRTLSEYSPLLLDQLISFTTSTFLICYILYTVYSETATRFGAEGLKYSTVFILYGIFRYLYLTYSKNLGGNPEDILVKDKPFLVNIVLYTIFIVCVIYFKG